MGKDYDSFGDFFHDVAEEYGEMSDTSLDSGDAHPLNKFVSDLAEAASRANGNHSEGRQGIDAEEVDVDVPSRNPGRRSGGKEIPDPPSLGDVNVGVSRGGERRSEGRGNRGSGGRKGLDAENVDLEYSGGGDRDVVDERPGISERNLEAMVENDYISRSEASTLKQHLGKKKHLTSEQIQRMGGEHSIISGNLKNRLLRALDGGKGYVMERSRECVSSTGGSSGGPEGVDVSEFGPEHVVELAEKGVLEEGEARTILERMGVDVPGGSSSGGGGRSSRGNDRRDEFEEDGEISVDEMVERFQSELERNR